MTESAASRTVARPVANLGNTCYMNAVLQALAHAPELCLAMDCEAHRSCCPIAAEKREKLRRSSSPDSAGSSGNIDGSENKRPVGTRKSRRSGRKTSPEASNEKFCALCELEEHLELVHDSTKRDKPVAPTAFVHGFIDRVAPWFRLGMQEDSHEFLRLLIDAMQKSCENARSSQARSSLATTTPPEGTAIEDVSAAAASGGGTAIKIEDDKEQPSPSPERKVIEKDTEYPFSLFRGTIESTVTCGSCGIASTTLDPIEDIGLEVAAPMTVMPTRNGTERTSRNASPAPAQSLYDVTTAFQRFSRPETLDSGYKCEKCGKGGKATKQSRLSSIPPILTLHLKRFRYGGGGAETTRRSQRSELGQLLGSADFAGRSGSAKIEGHCKFEPLFDLKPFLTEELQEKHSAMFCRLFAVVVHAGKNSHSGHYIAYVRNIAKNEWWKMDDGRVTPVPQTEVLRAEAYMLFYRVVQHPVATRLEQDYKNKMERRVSDVKPEDSPKNDDAGTRLSVAVHEFLRFRKRPLQSGEDGDTWIRKKTSVPPHMLGVARAIESEVASDKPTDELLKFIQDKISGAAVTSAQATEKADGEQADAVAEECEKYRRGILRAFYKALKMAESEHGISASELLKAPSTYPSPITTKTTTSNVKTALSTLAVDNPKSLIAPPAMKTSTAPDDKRVAVVEPAVVEPEEEMDLL